jgi:hypothetical protein
MPKNVGYGSDTAFPRKSPTIHEQTQSVRMKRAIGSQNRKPAGSTKTPRKAM